MTATNADATPEPESYATVLGNKLLEEGMLLVFEAEAGRLIKANDAAIFTLEMSEDSLEDYTFQSVVHSEEEDSADLWFELVAGARTHWKGQLKGVLSMTSTNVTCLTATLERDSETHLVVIHATKSAESTNESAGDTGIFAGMNDYLSVIEFDADGKVIDANERAETALEYYGGDLVGKKHEELWPRSETSKPEYVEFWEKLRQGRIIEQRHPHITAEGTIIWIQSTFVPIKSDDGMLRSVKQCMMDVTEQTVDAIEKKSFCEALKSIVPYIEYDKDGHVTDITDALCTKFGTKRTETIGKDHKKLLNSEFSKSEMYKIALKSAQEGIPAEVDINYYSESKTSDNFWLRGSIIPIKDQNGDVSAFIEIGFDITNDKNRLDDLAMRYELVQDFVGIMDFSISGEVLNANKRYCIASGFYEEDLVGKDYRQYVPKDIAQSNDFKDFWEKISEGEIIKGDFRRLGANGQQVWLRSCYAPLRKRRDERVRKIMSISTNITQDRQLISDQRGKVDAIEKYLGVAEYSTSGTLTYACKKFLKTMNYTYEEVKDKDHKMFFTEDFASGEGYSSLWRRLREGESINQEQHRLAGGGRDIWLDIYFAPIKDHLGNVTRIMEFSRDITDRKRSVNDAQKKLQTANNIFAVVEFDQSGKILNSNDGFLRMVGYTEREIVDQHHSILCTPELVTSPEYREFWLELSKGHTKSGLFQIKGRFESDIYIYGEYNPITNLLGSVESVVLFATDVSEYVKYHNKSQGAADKTLSHISSLKDSYDKSAKIVEQLSEVLRMSNQGIDKGTKHLEAGLEDMKKVKGSVGIIEETVSTVSEIATQTNLLAFNAAIEAARVGENGEGFSIVADEVRRLAEKNSDAAREIIAQISHISAGINSGAASAETAATSFAESIENINSGSSNIKDMVTISSSEKELMQLATSLLDELKELGTD